MKNSTIIGLQNEMGVLILLSTYNGEKYISEQLDSLLSQTYPIYVLIRDDGSTDSTVSIIKQYMEHSNNIFLIEGKNVGVVSSFNELMMNSMVDEFDFVAFCDQDDVWEPIKIEAAMESIRTNNENDLPVLYCSNLKVVDENLNYIRDMRNTPIFSKKSALVQNIATGCTEVFNHRAVELYRKIIGYYIEIHDYMMYLICVYFGKVVYDPEPHILYRQHSKNVIGYSRTTINEAISNMTIAGKRVKTLLSFNRVFGNDLNAKDKRDIETMINYDKCLKNRIILLFDPRFRGNNLRVTIGFKIRILRKKLY